ncbi:hypothetical protein F5B22DRAFT_588434 [Xylaria bambusicola]|uniref:uncharacterized protein n=1 Tax=Xylaria bambusicola TaxID=326684 RepID=UPI00200763D6|nr:uncharacterized protein F5B22DRAFT_588434 [Xylaria bambusicola]KAI0525946.1 hypothetical protein F5B22DRAFT_588434 [Xylaria bambusicola]
MMASVDNIVRPVGSQAKFNTARHSLGILRAVIVTCRYRIPATHLRQQSASLQDAVESALANVVLRQAILGVGIAAEDTKEPVFIHLKTIDMRRMIEWKEIITPGATSDIHTETKKKEALYEDRLLRALEKYHEPVWEDLAGKPGWKIVVHHDPRQLGVKDDKDDALLSFDISFCFHHAYSDGRGGYIFHSDLQRALNEGARPTELQNHILHLLTPPAIPPAMSDLIPLSLSWAYILRTVWTEIVGAIPMPFFIRRLLGFEPNKAEIPWTGAPIDALNPKTHVRTLFKIEDEAQLTRILAQCRSHKTTLTGLLHALIARSLACHVKDRSFRSSTPISLAGYADPKVVGSTFTPGETIHCLVTGFQCNHDLDTVRQLRQSGDKNGTRVGEDQTVWAFAQDMTARLRAKAASLPRDDIIGLSGLIGDWHEFFRKKFGKARADTWELSNLGSLAVVDTGFSGSEDAGNDQSAGKAERWFIDRAVFTQGNSTGPAVNINVAGVAAHGIHATVCWQDGVVDVELVEKLVRDVQTWVAGLVG